MKILITGSNGFIGKNLKEFFEENYVVSAPKRDELNLLDTNEVKKYLINNKFDVVLHCGVTLLSINDNLEMYYNISNCHKNFGKMICVGSGAEFDKRHYYPKMEENYFKKYKPDKSDIYGYSKYKIAEDIIQKSLNIYNLRVFGIFGKYEDYRRRFISNNICRVLSGKNILMNKNMFFDFMYVNDFCKIVEKFFDVSPKENTYNICTSAPIDFITIANIINDLLDQKVKIEIKEPGLNPEYSGSNQKFINEFGNFDFINPEKSIRDLYFWYKNKSGLTFDEKVFDQWIKN